MPRQRRQIERGDRHAFRQGYQHFFTGEHAQSRSAYLKLTAEHVLKAVCQLFGVSLLQRWQQRKLVKQRLLAGGEVEGTIATARRGAVASQCIQFAFRKQIAASHTLPTAAQRR